MTPIYYKYYTLYIIMYLLHAADDSCVRHHELVEGGGKRCDRRRRQMGIYSQGKQPGYQQNSLDTFAINDFQIHVLLQDHLLSRRIVIHGRIRRPTRRSLLLVLHDGNEREGIAAHLHKAAQHNQFRDKGTILYLLKGFQVWETVMGNIMASFTILSFNLRTP